MVNPRYSGSTRSGVCICGHSWDEHHLGFVMQQEYLEQTREGYLPQECEHYGFNEAGGLMPNVEGDWIEHCGGYIDQLDKERQSDSGL